MNEFRKRLDHHGYVHDPIRWREERAFGHLDEVMYSYGLRLADAEIEWKERHGGLEQYYRWKEMDGDWVAGAFEDELGTRIPVTSSLAVVYGRRTPGGYTAFLQLKIAASVEASTAGDPIFERNSQLYKYGAMGVIAPHEGRGQVPSYVQNVVITVSSARGGAAATIDEIVAEVLNLVLSDKEVVYFYPNASLDEFADSDERVRFYAQSVSRALVMEKNPSVYLPPWE